MNNGQSSRHSNSMEMLKNVGLIIGGLVLLLYTLGLMQKGISFLLIIAAVAMMTYGASSIGLIDYVKNMLNKNRKHR
jgi:uncharacterized membrane protein